ncbi:hypothetical protein BGY98DRAFT_990855, partial [Russula aff. rugulosa BPL654]
SAPFTFSYVFFNINGALLCRSSSPPIIVPSIFSLSSSLPGSPPSRRASRCWSMVHWQDSGLRLNKEESRTRNCRSCSSLSIGVITKLAARRCDSRGFGGRSREGLGLSYRSTRVTSRPSPASWRALMDGVNKSPVSLLLEYVSLSSCSSSKRSKGSSPSPNCRQRESPSMSPSSMRRPLGEEVWKGSAVRRLKGYASCVSTYCAERSKTFAPLGTVDPSLDHIRVLQTVTALYKHPS